MAKNKTNFFRRAFTLLEIMVALGIISLIVSVGTFSYSQVNKNSRDATRKVDLQNISQTLELYRSNHIFGSYPQNLSDLSPAYLSVLPVDPKTKISYSYTPTCTTSAPIVCTTYVLSADLESSTTDYALGPYGEITVQAPTSAPTIAPTTAPTAGPTTGPTNTPAPAPIQTSTPTPISIVCSPKTQTNSVYNSVSFTVSGEGPSYTWSTSPLGGCTTCSGSGSSFTTSFNWTGSKTVTVSSNSKSDTCSVNVIGGDVTPTPQPTSCLQACQQKGFTTAFCRNNGCTPNETTAQYVCSGGSFCCCK